MKLSYEITAAITTGKDNEGKDRTSYQRVGSIFETSKEGMFSVSLSHRLTNPSDALLLRSPDKDAEFNDEPNQVIGEVSSVTKMGDKTIYTQIGVVLSTQNSKVRVLKLNLEPVDSEAGMIIQPPRKAKEGDEAAA